MYAPGGLLLSIVTVFLRRKLMSTLYFLKYHKYKKLSNMQKIQMERHNFLVSRSFRFFYIAFKQHIFNPIIQIQVKITIEDSSSKTKEMKRKFQGVNPDERKKDAFTLSLYFYWFSHIRNLFIIDFSDSTFQ